MNRSAAPSLPASQPAREDRLDAAGHRPTATAPVEPRPRIDRLLRFPAVRERTGLSRSTIWRLERRGEFPRHHRIAPNIVAWKESDVSRWIQLRTDASST
jgi:prophage regulatory protein